MFRIAAMAVLVAAGVLTAACSNGDPLEQASNSSAESGVSWDSLRTSLDLSCGPRADLSGFGLLWKPWIR